MQVQMVNLRMGGSGCRVKLALRVPMPVCRRFASKTRYSKALLRHSACQCMCYSRRQLTRALQTPEKSMLKWMKRRKSSRTIEDS